MTNKAIIKTQQEGDCELFFDEAPTWFGVMSCNFPNHSKCLSIGLHPVTQDFTCQFAKLCQRTHEIASAELRIQLAVINRMATILDKGKVPSNFSGDLFLGQRSRRISILSSGMLCMLTAWVSSMPSIRFVHQSFGSQSNPAHSESSPLSSVCCVFLFLLPSMAPCRLFSLRLS